MKYFLADAVALVITVALFDASIWFGTGAATDWHRYHDEPIEFDVGAATQASSEGRQWVSVASAAWRCDQSMQRGVSTFVPVWSGAGALLALALFPWRRLAGRFHARNHDRLAAAAFAPEESNEASRIVRKHGATLVVVALGAFLVGDGWVIGGFIPVRWFAATAVLLGTAMIAFPLQYRRLHRNGLFGKR